MRASQRCEARPCILDLSASIDDCAIPSKSTTPPTLGIFDLELTRVAAVACCLLYCYFHRSSYDVAKRASDMHNHAADMIEALVLRIVELNDTIAELRALREVDKGKLEAAEAERQSRISPLDSDTDGNEGESEM